MTAQRTSKSVRMPMRMAEHKRRLGLEAIAAIRSEHGLPTDNDDQEHDDDPDT